jgi:hypothetical protein
MLMYFVYRTREFMFSNFVCQKLFSERFIFGAFAAIFV